MHFLDELNSMQRQAALCTEGPLLIFAGAGSGKTRVLTYRIARLVEQGIDPYHIIAITFTNKAAREMRERAGAVLQKTGVSPNGDVWVSTFHSTCVRFLRRDIHRMGFDNGFSIFDAQDSERLIKQCIAAQNVDEKQYPVRYVSSVISAQKNELIGPGEFERQSANDFRMSNIAEMYTEYQRKLQANNALDFDDIIFYTVKLFETQPEVLRRYQNRFRYVMVDEYQDTNTAQYRLVRLLSGYADNLCVVGDDDQSIYGWRGANIKNIQSFGKDFPNARIIKLEQNYRSTQKILNAANAVIAHNYNRSPKKLWTENEAGEQIRLYKASDENAEGAFVAGTVKRGVQAGGKYHDFAVLYRNNVQSRAVEDQLVFAGIPYRLFGGVRFYERLEVKDILSYLKALHNPADNLAYTRIINVPRRGIGQTTVNRVLAYAAEKGVPFSTALREAENIPDIKSAAGKLKSFAASMDEWARYAEGNPVSALLQKILDETDYLASVLDGTEEGVGRAENVRELLTKAVEFEANAEVKTLGAFLEDVALVADIDQYEENADTVALMTMHSAKGLEFNTVFIVGAEENIFPSARSILSPSPDDLEEERRLCYVGFTRARKTLYVTHAVSRMQYGQTVSNAMSRFISEVPKEYIENITPKPKGFGGGHLQRESYREKTRQGNNGGNAPAKPVPGGPVSSRAPTGGSPSGYANPYLSKPTVGSQKPAHEKAAYKVGDRVRQAPYGTGLIISMRDVKGDLELSVAFEGMGVKKFMAHMAKLEKV
ncbi:MAG: UvrD-helicase domain-containing protein [Clostridiales bacterium]|nr:UvrD-helicase domain-containing protein [Clostridiales bacterium]